MIDREISEKMNKLNEPGKTVESMLSEVEHSEWESPKDREQKAPCLNKCQLEQWTIS